MQFNSHYGLYFKNNAMDNKVKKLLQKDTSEYTDQEWQDSWNAQKLIDAEEIKMDSEKYKRALVHIEVKKGRLKEEEAAANRVN